MTMGQDLFFVVNGDWIDGTGLAINGDPSYLIPILEKMPWDALNCGNHELYRRDVIDYMSRPAGWLDWWGLKYLTSNIIDSNTQKNFGNQFRLLKGPTSTVLTFGFLYNMKDSDSTVTVQQVETVVAEAWFSNALKTPGIDAILVLAHMGHDDHLISVILAKIRSIVGPNMPVQFVAGHTHKRGVHNPDATSLSLEAGRYLDTVGFVSFPRKDTLASASTNTTSMFQYRFLDASRSVLETALNGPTLGTSEGTALSAFIHRIQDELGLREVVGCVPERYFYNKSIFASNSVWGLFEREVVPRLFDGRDVVMFSTELARYDLLPGDIILDEVIGMIPFNETLFKFSDLPVKVVVQLNKTINSQVLPYMPSLPPYTFASTKPLPVVDLNSTTMMGNQTSGELYDLITSEFVVDRIQEELQKLYPQTSEPTAIPTGVLDVWLRFFKEEHLCQTKHKGNHRPSSHPHQHQNGTGLPHFGFEGSDDEKDQARLAFAVVALAMLALLGSVYVWQRGATYKRDANARERIILEAQREFEGDEYSDEDFDRELL